MSWREFQNLVLWVRYERVRRIEERSFWRPERWLGRGEGIQDEGGGSGGSESGFLVLITIIWGSCSELKAGAPPQDGSRRSDCAIGRATQLLFRVEVGKSSEKGDIVNIIVL